MEEEADEVNAAAEEVLIDWTGKRRIRKFCFIFLVIVMVLSFLA